MAYMPSNILTLDDILLFAADAWETKFIQFIITLEEKVLKIIYQEFIFKTKVQNLVMIFFHRIKEH